jgi:hypothetical protein
MCGERFSKERDYNMLHNGGNNREYAGFEGGRSETSGAQHYSARGEEREQTTIRPESGSGGGRSSTNELIESAIAFGNASMRFAWDQFQNAFRLMLWPMQSTMNMMGGQNTRNWGASQGRSGHSYRF